MRSPLPPDGTPSPVRQDVAEVRPEEPLLPSPSPASPAPRTVAEPLTAELRRLHVTVSKRFLEKLDAARDALSHSHPGADAEAILEAGLDLVIERAAGRRPSPTSASYVSHVIFSLRGSSSARRGWTGSRHEVASAAPPRTSKRRRGPGEGEPRGPGGRPIRCREGLPPPAMRLRSPTPRRCRFWRGHGPGGDGRYANRARGRGAHPRGLGPSPTLDMATHRACSRPSLAQPAAPLTRAARA